MYILPEEFGSAALICMRPFFAVCSLAATVVVAPLARADSTVAAHQVGTSQGMSISGETTVFVKGLRQRTDAFIRGQQLTTLVDLGTLTATIVDHGLKQARIFRLEPVSLTTNGQRGEVRVQLEPTGQTRTVSGLACAELSAVVSQARSDLKDESTRPLIEGTVWVAPDGVGADDVRLFYAGARERRVAVGDPRAVKVNQMRSFALTLLIARAAEMGLVCGMRVEFRDDTSPSAGGASMTTEVTKVSSSPVDERLFAIPAGYLVEQP